jgi:uncharacterized protein YjbJ (UPF0337 family)
MTPISPNCSRIGALSFASSARRTASRPTPTRKTAMKWNVIQVDWINFKNKVHSNWVKLTDEDITRIAGRREELIGRLRARYGFAKAEADREVETWVRSQRHAA